MNLGRQVLISVQAQGLRQRRSNSGGLNVFLHNHSYTHTHSSAVAYNAQQIPVCFVFFPYQKLIPRLLPGCEENVDK